MEKFISIFDKIENDKFFVPLNSEHKAEYYEIGQEIIRYSLEVNPVVPYEIAVSKAAAVLKRNGVVGDSAEMIRRMSIYGWLTEKRLTSDNHYVITVTKDCSRILSALDEYSRSGDSEMLNHLYSMCEIFADVFNNKKPSERRVSPYESIFREIVQHRKDLAREMGELYNSLDARIKGLLQIRTLEELMEITFKGDITKNLFASYYRLKHGGQTTIMLNKIDNYIDMLVADDALMKATASGYAVANETSEETALREIKSKYYEIQGWLSRNETSCFGTIEKRIDDKLNSYIGNLCERFRCIYDASSNLQAVINEYLMAVQKHDNLDEVADISSAIMLKKNMTISDASYRSISYGKLTTEESDALTESGLTDEEKILKTKEWKDSSQNRYSIENVVPMIDALMGDSDSLTLNSSMLKDRETGKVLASAITFSGQPHFPFEIEQLDYFIENDVIKMKNIKIRRKK